MDLALSGIVLSLLLLLLLLLLEEFLLLLLVCGRPSIGHDWTLRFQSLHLRTEWIKDFTDKGFTVENFLYQFLSEYNRCDFSALFISHDMGYLTRTDGGFR